MISLLNCNKHQKIFEYRNKNQYNFNKHIVNYQIKLNRVDKNNYKFYNSNTIITDKAHDRLQVTLISNNLNKNKI